MTLKNAVTKGVKAWRDRRIDPKTGEYYLLTSANLAELNGFKAMYRTLSGTTSTRPPILSNGLSGFYATAHILNYQNNAH